MLVKRKHLAHQTTLLAGSRRHATVRLIAGTQAASQLCYPRLLPPPASARAAARSTLCCRHSSTPSPRVNPPVPTTCAASLVVAAFFAVAVAARALLLRRRSAAAHGALSRGLRGRVPQVHYATSQVHRNVRRAFALQVLDVQALSGLGLEPSLQRGVCGLQRRQERARPRKHAAGGERANVGPCGRPAVALQQQPALCGPAPAVFETEVKLMSLTTSSQGRRCRFRHQACMFKNVAVRARVRTSMSTANLWQSTLQALGTPPSAGAHGTSRRSRFTPCVLDIAVTAGGRVCPYSFTEAGARQPRQGAALLLKQSPQKVCRALQIQKQLSHLLAVYGAPKLGGR